MHHFRRVRPVLGLFSGFVQRSGRPVLNRSMGVQVSHPEPTGVQRPIKGTVGPSFSLLFQIQGMTKPHWTKATYESVHPFVANVSCMSDLRRALAAHGIESGYRQVKNILVTHALDTSHWISKRFRGAIARTLEELMIEQGDPNAREMIKKKILQQGTLEYACAICPHRGEWMGAELVLHLDHKNGNSRDHRLSNLRFLCPNCHSQTPTYCGRNNRTRSPQSDLNRTCHCGKSKDPASTKCKQCYLDQPRPSGRPDVVWPSQSILTEMVQGSSLAAVARSLGVSSPAVRYHLKKPPTDPSQKV